MEAGLKLDGLDWSRPWFAPWRDPGEGAAAHWQAGAPVHQALNAAAPAGASLRFVSQGELPPGTAYERYVFETGRCPTREGAHDFFNGLVWLGMPKAKQRLNALQAAEIETRGVGAVRGPVRDAITVFDENGALLQAPQPLWQALLQRRWHDLFTVLRPLWAQARLLVVGHALLEKLLQPRKDLTAHVWCADAPLDTDRAAADEWLANALDAPALAAKPFTPLPLLGVPGWWPANEDVCFYDDARVFRPARAGRT